MFGMTLERERLQYQVSSHPAWAASPSLFQLVLTRFTVVIGIRELGCTQDVKYKLLTN